ncbi:MAG: response regulator, partial [Bdellovibrionales bacterium]|nr:response regulator [Bdellovibrionales bacterium]
MQPVAQPMMQPFTTRILIAESSQFLVEKLRNSLREHGFQVQAVESGAAALEATREWKPHFVLYDMVMQDLSGPNFLKNLQTEDL